MIRYALACDAGHRFESWFRDSSAFDTQSASDLVTCPDCGSRHVAKTMMAPAIAARRAAPVRSGAPASESGASEFGASRPSSSRPSSSRPAASRPAASEPGAFEPGSSEPPASEPGALDLRARETRAALRAFREAVMTQAEDVGPRFAEEARRIHDGDLPLRHIRGQATLEQARELLDDGIPVLPLPPGPADLN